jgi:hypothetical protein
MTTRVPASMLGALAPSGDGGAMDVQGSLDLSLADGVDEESEVTAGPFVDLKHDCRSPC